MSTTENEKEGFNLDVALALYENSVPISVGHATIAWNTLCGSVFYIYHDLSGMSPEAAKATFFVITSDRSQRDMTGELAKIKLKPEAPRLNKKIQKLLASINDLAGKRNDILHVVYENTLSPASVKQFHERGHLKGTSGKEMLQRIHAFTMEAMDLATLALKCSGEILDHQKASIAAQPRPLSIALQWPQGHSSQEGYGLLGLLATNPQSPEEDPPAEPVA